MNGASVRRASAVVLLLALAVVVALVPGTTEAAKRAKWDTRVFSRVPNPGFPAYVYHHPNGRVYAGTYTNPNGDKIRSRVFEWTSSGTLLRSWTVPGQKLTDEHGVQVATSDARGRLVLLEKSTAGVLTLDIRTGTFKRQATLPDSKASGHPIPNYASWGPQGALFVTDYGQGVIWRIPAAGGKPKAWFASSALEGTGFGTTGIVYQPKLHRFLIGQQTTSSLTSTALAGRIYKLPVSGSGKHGKISTFWKSPVLALPDGFGVAASGHVYVANLLRNQIVELSAAGKEIDKFPKSTSGKNGTKVPFDGPSNATFVGTRILVANQSPVLGTKENLVLFDVEVGEKGAAAYLPKASRLR
ncbi:MAG: hypothetical protein JWQ74_1425 [Marmoricola sp.]|nr:hypothetical protein [Marmoricola sp.]